MYLLLFTAALGVFSEAPSADVRNFALVVGQNRGGTRQAQLRFAENDALRTADVLQELGHYDASDVFRLLGPSRAQVLQALSDLRERVSDAQKTSAAVNVF